jgi:tRNA-Thr(GGU) m(6)t(6)A37 methyltransferase TsaA
MISLSPIATVRNARQAITDDDWGHVISAIELLDPLNEEALEHIEDFSHVEVIFLFDRVDEQDIETGARHPRDNPRWPRVGILAQRGKNRPNRLGHTIVRVVRRAGRALEVEGLDAIDGTPVLDIKPVMKEFLPRGEVRQPEWATELMKNYWDIKPARDGSR